MKKFFLSIVLLFIGFIANCQNVFYVNDNTNFFTKLFTTSVGNDANPGTAALPFATIQHAADVATEGSIIYVDAGIYTEQVTLNKGLSLIGAGSGVTLIFKPAIINPPPGPFTEPGTIQSAQNIGDVQIRDVSITGGDNVVPIVLQTGGSVKFCRLIGGGQGIFFRVDPAIKTAVIENNYINVQSIGINCQGSGLTAMLTNNTIDLNNPYFAAGVFAGLDFGPLVRFTAFGNSISNYNYVGFLANSYNTNITQNSILGTGQHAIEQSTNSLGFATCNWYGTTNAVTIASKVSGLFSYTPYLTSGTNSISNNGSGGFVPLEGSCGEGVNNFYVNDNSRTNDVFTTAVGSNSNSGTSSAPFSTLSYAIISVPANSVIHVDSGTYAEQVIIDKGIVINGAGRELTNFVKPASALIPAPGPFTEIGLIETTQGIGDVHIRNISVNSDDSSQNIIIQSGGSVKNCKLLNGGQGVFFRIASGSRTATVEANIIQPNGIGINCQGAGLTANIVNNTISKAGGYFAGIFAGLDFGALPQITITNNKISDYFSLGILANANISNVTNNSIVGTPQSIAIQGNALNATCNWYGSNAPSIAGPVIYSPFLTSGTDNDIYNQGFQPVPDSCTEIQNKFYVNDNNNVGNVFTTAVGDDINNNGGPSAPLATIAKALSKAQAGDSIYVDAGNYTEAVNVTKDITIRGAGMGITILNGPTTHIIPPAGSSESGIIQSTAGLTNVIIENMTIDGSVSDEGHGTFIQGGGRISNCELRYVNDGFYFQYLSTESRTAVGNNNYVHHINYVGALFAGNGLNASATNNVIDLTGALYGIGFIAGYGGSGNLASFTASNNSIIKFNGFGIMVGSLQTAQIHDNSITRITGNYFENRHTVNVDATCNWFGTNNASVIIPNVSGDVAYSPWLSNGTDNDVAFGFQPVPVSCNGLRLSAILDGSTNVSCNGANNGSINITVTSGVAPYTFAWTRASDPTIISTNEYPTNLAPGIYHVKITDALGTNVLVNNAGAVYKIDVNITEPDELTALTNGTNVSCFNGSNGSATVTSAGGTAPYTYLWSNAATTQNIISLAAGVYTITVTDANGCTKTASYEVTQPTILNASANGSNVSCFNGTNGSASANVSGGTTPYTYLWSNADTTQNISNLTAGIYNVMATDANGCTKTASYEVTQPSILNASANGSNVSCFNSTNGSVSANVSGGTTPYTYLWSNAATTQNISNLIAGIYNVTVTDANGCTKTASFEVTQPPLLTVTMTGTTASCNGSTTATPAGGTAPYNYLWSNGSISQTISNLPAGTYTTTVKDANNCTVTGSFTIIGNSNINPNTSLANVSCFGGTNGSIIVTSAGGTAPRTYNLNGSAFQNNNVFSNLTAGVYVVGVKDANGCSDFVTRTITQPALLTVTTSSIQKTCFGQNNGGISISVSGGSGAKTYSWSGPNGYTSAAQNPSNLLAGNYSLLVTDAKGCTATLNATVASFGEIIVTSITTNVLCRGSLTGAINLTVSGGSGSGFTYSWSGSTTSTSEDISNVAPGTNYKVTITDIGSGCTVSKTYTITQPGNLVISTTKTNVTGCNSLGTITITGSGGTGGYMYSIDGTNYQVANTFTGLLAGSYTALVKDANGCTKSSALISITDNGSDEYEILNSSNNNSKNQARLISIGTTINARIALATDTADWFKFATPAGNGNYKLTISHPTVNYTFNMYPSGNNAAALVTTSSTSTSKTYALTGGTTYFVQITGALSYTCYDLSILPVISAAKYAPNTSKVIYTELTVKAYPNPHQGLFNLSIISPEDGKAQIELFTVLGQLLAKREVLIEKNQNTIVEFNNVGRGMILYRITIDNKELNGKVYGKD